MIDQSEAVESGDPAVLARHKNKLAQQRYRERQRVKKSSMASQIAALERRVAKLQTTHQDLASKNRDLEDRAADIKAKQGLVRADTEASQEVHLPTSSICECSSMLLAELRLEVVQHDNPWKTYLDPLEKSAQAVNQVAPQICSSDNCVIFEPLNEGLAKDLRLVLKFGNTVFGPLL